jgi:hypothetical protein
MFTDGNYHELEPKDWLAPENVVGRGTCLDMHANPSQTQRVQRAVFCPETVTGRYLRCKSGSISQSC